MPNETPTIPTRSTKKPVLGGSPSQKTFVSWNPEVSREEKYRQLFWSEMGRALIQSTSDTTEIASRADAIMNAIHNWCVRNSAEILGCRVVLRGRSVDVLVYEPLREFHEHFSLQISELGIELAQL